MKTLKGLTPKVIECVDGDRNRFQAKTGETVLKVRQPNRLDKRRHKKAWNMLSRETLHLYRRKYAPEELYDSKYRCMLPYYRGDVPGWLPLIMEIDDSIVGFGDMYFKYGTEYQVHDIEDSEVGCSMNLCVLDKYQGLGIGTYYGHISVFIASWFGADYALGYTTLRDGMYGIRMRDGWEHLKTYGDYAVIRKRLGETII